MGDVLFQAKCFAKIREFKERGTTIVFVTHSLDLVTSHCSRALLLDKGELLADQSPKATIGEYNRIIAMRDPLTGEISICVPERTAQNWLIQRN